jgi:hypothetical protein
MEGYLTKRQGECKASFDLELQGRDEEFTRFWRYTGLPMKASHLTLDSKKLAAHGLINPKDIMHSFKAHRQTEVLQPPPVHVFNDITVAPHHLASTHAGEVRAQAVARKLALGQQKKLSSWTNFDVEQVQKLVKASKERQKQAALRMSGALLQSASLTWTPSSLTPPQRCALASVSVR